MGHASKSTPRAYGESFVPLKLMTVPLLAFASALAPKAEAQSFVAPGACYRFDSTETPDRTERVSPRSEIWCYRPIDRPVGAMFIFNADQAEVRPELSAVIEADGSITHGSLLAGQVTIHRLKKSNYNPLPVPLTPPIGVDSIAGAEVVASHSAALIGLKHLFTQSASDADIVVRAGDYEGKAQANIRPWRGYWWPYSSGRLHNGSDSPLAKYDRLVKERTGVNPGAQAWEKDNHSYSGVNWEGHCNGWAAASVLRAEPQAARTINGIKFSISDQKGLLSEKDYCAKYLFFGKRYRGQADNDIKDIYAGIFHNTLTYYIGQLKKPLVMDYMRERAVDNHVVSGYTMKIAPDGAGIFKVTTTVHMHRYDKNRVNAPGQAAPYTRVFKYRIWVDDDGLITGSQWLSTNPDFLWVPLSPDSCSSSNPKVTEEWIREITGV